MTMAVFTTQLAFHGIILMCCFLVFSGAQKFTGDPIVARVYQRALLSCHSPCFHDVKWMFSAQTQMPVVQCRNKICHKENGFTKRAKLTPEQFGQGNLSLLLDPVFYSDEGWYTCFCGSKTVSRIHLEVIFTAEVKTLVGGNVTLPCYAHVDKGVNKSEIAIKWEKDGQPVVTYQRGTFTVAPKFKGRAELSSDTYQDGSLPLTLTDLKEDDTGLYRCTHGGREHVTPGNFNLLVTEPTTSWCQPVLVTLAILNLVTFIVWLLAKYCKK